MHNWRIQVSNQWHVRKDHVPLCLTIQSALDCDWRSSVQGAKDPNAYTSQKLTSEVTLHLARFLIHEGVTAMTYKLTILVCRSVTRRAWSRTKRSFGTLTEISRIAFQADCIVSTRIGRTFVDKLFTLRASETSSALAFIMCEAVYTASTINTRIWMACVKT